MRLVFIFSLLTLTIFGQYAPPAGQPGSTAVHKDSTLIKAWSTTCTVTRGPMDITDPSKGEASAGSAASATGKADNAPVSLGDGGYAVCEFSYPIINGPGYDLVVFENAFEDYFLELAFVEVSSDGKNYYRFPSHSLTDTLNQTTSFDSTDATRINNLAGKYRSGYGTPFDLEELKNEPGLNVMNVTHVRIKDVVGCLQNSVATRDAANNKVNDPWPTPFPSSGFDLDAVGVINQSTTTAVAQHNLNVTNVWPNPVTTGGILHFSEKGFLEASLFDLSGKFIMHTNLPGIVMNVKPDVYQVIIKTENGSVTKKVIVTAQSMR